MEEDEEDVTEDSEESDSNDRTIIRGSKMYGAIYNIHTSPHRSIITAKDQQFSGNVSGERARQNEIDSTRETFDRAV